MKNSLIEKFIRFFIIKRIFSFLFLIWFINSFFTQQSFSQPEEKEILTKDLLPKKNNSLLIEGWTVVDEGTEDAPSAWFASDGVLIQSSNIYGGSEKGIDPEKYGTYALYDKEIKNYSLSLKLCSKDNDAIGVMFRYKNNDNYYRFSMDSQRSYRRLIKKQEGKVKILNEDQFSYEKNIWYKVDIILKDSNIKIYINEKLIFNFNDSNGIKSGKIALYSWGNAGSEYKDLRLTFMDDLTIFDEGNIDSPSLWSIDNGVLLQSGNIHNNIDENGEQLGTYALIGEDDWNDYILNLSLRSRNTNTIGVIYRFNDKDNYYCFLIDREKSYRRFVKKLNGKIFILAEDKVSYDINKWYSIKIRGFKNSIKLYLDDNMLFDVVDDAVSKGKIGLYCWKNAGSEFKNIVISPLLKDN